MNSILEENTSLFSKKIETTILNSKFKSIIKKISLFGSSLKLPISKTNDIDLLFEFEESSKVGFFTIFNITELLEGKLNKKVDIVTNKALSKYFRKDILTNCKTIYEK